MITWLLVALGVAWGSGFAETLTQAANADLSDTERMVLFESLVAEYPGNKESLVTIAQKDDAPPRERWVAIRVLGQTGSRELSPLIIGLCSDSRPTIRVAALSAIGDLKPNNAAEEVVKALKDPALVVRGTAADTLAILKDITAIAPLEEALADPSNYYRGQSVWARSRFVLALGAIGSRNAFPALQQALSDDDPQVVESTLTALRQIVGYDFAEGRTPEEHIAAWQRWLAAQ
ncbi:MAG: HEAT repeat domain-containing protein [Myxococcota bacterium]|nr:HEAT repeat domain-containing protein [Myxococcota bacterium]